MQICNYSPDYSSVSNWALPTGVPIYCVKEEWLCDNEDDCSDRSDEICPRK